MLTRIVSGVALPAIAGAAMLLSSLSPSSAFTLSSPSPGQPVAAAGVEHVWWRHGGGWHAHGWGWHAHGWGGHPWGWHPWGWHRPVYGFYGAPVRHCWIGRWGHRHCAW